MSSNTPLPNIIPRLVAYNWPLSFVMSSLLSLAGEGGRRPDEGGSIKNNTKNLLKNLANAERVINCLRNSKFQVGENYVDFVCIGKSLIFVYASQQLEHLIDSKI
jgi:hypothetical protein